MSVLTLTTLPTSWDDPVLSRTQAEELLAQPHHLLLAIGPAEMPDAYLFARCIPHTPADILTVFVNPAHRRKGRALQLMQHLLLLAREGGCTGLTLEVDATNDAAIRLYTACGLTHLTTRRGYYTHAGQPPTDALVFSKSWA